MAVELLLPAGAGIIAIGIALPLLVPTRALRSGENQKFLELIGSVVAAVPADYTRYS